MRTIPIIKLYGNLLVSVQVALSDRVILELKEDIAREIRRSDVHGLVIEVSGVDLFDSFIARSIQDIAQIARLMGVRTVLAGLNAGMAITLVEMDMELEGVQTALSLESALDMLARARGKEPDTQAERLLLAE
ncbi:MAG: STAS domain-containing protein [Polyangiales bacterium]